MGVKALTPADRRCAAAGSAGAGQRPGSRSLPVAGDGYGGPEGPSARLRAAASRGSQHGIGPTVKARDLRSCHLKEQSIQKAVVELLQVSARPGVAWTHMPAGEARGAGIGGKLKGMGTKPGWPDLILVMGGHLYGLELKRDAGRLSPAQIAAHQELAEAGATVVTAYGLDDAIRVLKGWGMVR